jgi:hypothetical protein
MGEITTISDRKRRRHDTLTRINDQVDSVERIIVQLLDTVDIEELTAYERLNTAIKFMSQHARLMMLRQSCELDEPENASALMIEAFQRQLRGEVAAGPVVEEGQDG